jgi:chromate transporter
LSGSGVTSRCPAHVPVPASVDLWSLALALVAALAIFRFKVGMIPTLAGCCLAGVALNLAGFLTTVPH